MTIATVTAAVVTIFSAWLAGFSYFYLAGPVIMLGIWVIIVLMAAYFKQKFSGLTGDTYGAINEVTEVVALLLVILLASNNWLI